MQKMTFCLLVAIIAFLSFPLSAQNIDDGDAQLRASNAESDISDRLYFSLTDQNGKFDRFFIVFSSLYSESYKASEDAMTMSTYYGNQPALYCLDRSNQPMALYGVPMIKNRVVPVGFSVPQAGTYTFKVELRKIQEIYTLKLIDNQEQKTINLLQYPTYTFTTTGTETSNTRRFTLLINVDEAVMVSGDVRISGTMRSEGAVHIFADGDTGKVHIDNSDASAMLVADTIVLYSNDSADGLLMNENTLGGGVKGIDANNPQLPSAQPNRVILRKSLEEKKYTYLSLPFNVQESNVTDAGGRPLVGGGQDYWAVEFDAKVRSDSSTVDSEKTWREHDYAKGFEKGTGYMVWFESATERAYMDFMTNTPAMINELFSATADKTKSYKIYGAASSIGWDHPEYGDGWAFIGGLNTTTYTLKENSIKGYDGSAVWYRKERTSQAMGTKHGDYGIAVIAEGDSLMISPYAPFWIQDTKNVVAGDSVINNFTFTPPTGLSLESSKFRSGGDNRRDRLHFTLSSDDDHSSNRFYLVFAGDYVESYRASEDAVSMSTFFQDSPVAWSLDEMNRELALNGLPMKDDRKVRMGFSVPGDGSYTLRLDPKKLTDVRNVILVDNVTGKKIDLLKTSYSFNTGAVVKENNRFALFINSSYTDISPVNAAKPYAYTKDNVLIISNLTTGDNVSVYDLAGRTVVSGKATGREFSAALHQKGVFVVNVKGGDSTVLKVLNK